MIEEQPFTGSKKIAHEGAELAVGPRGLGSVEHYAAHETHGGQVSYQRVTPEPRGEVAAFLRIREGHSRAKCCGTILLIVLF